MSHANATGQAPVVKTRISAGSIARYFSGGSEASGGSNFSVMCERAALSVHKHASVKCRACEGQGFRVLTPDDLVAWRRRIAEVAKKLEEEKDSERRDELIERQDEIRKQMSKASTCTACDGSGYTTAKNIDRASAMDSMFTTVRCSSCQATGVDRRRSAVARLLLGDGCERCRPRDELGQPLDDGPGPGFIVPVSVKEKGSSKSGKPPKREPGGDDGAEPTNDVVAASWVDEDKLAERGRVSRLLEAIRRDDPEVAEALAVFNGADGDKWGGHKWGRLFALWQCVPAGKQLAKDGAARSKGGHGWLIGSTDLIAGEREAEQRATEPNRHRRALIGQADREARALKARMDQKLRAVEAA